MKVVRILAEAAVLMVAVLVAVGIALATSQVIYNVTGSTALGIVTLIGVMLVFSALFVHSLEED